MIATSVALGAAHHGEPEHPVKVQCAVEIWCPLFEHQQYECPWVTRHELNAFDDPEEVL